MTLYQVWEETSIGGTFSTKQKAAVSLGFTSVKEYEKQTGIDYPDIREIEVDKPVYWDR